jgi:hypothetical protein
MEGLREDTLGSTTNLTRSDSGAPGYTRGATLRVDASNVTHAQRAEVPETEAERLPVFLLAYRASTHSTTDTTPASMVFGRELHLPYYLLFALPPTSSSRRRPTTWWISWIGCMISITTPVSIWK